MSQWAKCFNTSIPKCVLVGKMLEYLQIKICPSEQNASISPDQNMSQWVKYLDTHKPKYVPGTKDFNTPILYTTHFGTSRINGSSISNKRSCSNENFWIRHHSINNFKQKWKP